MKTLELNPPLEQLDAAARASRVIAEHLEALIAARRRAPTDDLLSELIHVEEQGDQLSHDELITTVMLLFGAGFETTTNLIGNGLLALLDHPDELRRLRDDRVAHEDRGRGAAALGRAGSGRRPQGRSRTSTSHGLRVAAGEQFVTLLGAANRDPRVFDDPERFDVGRVAQAPMSFGAGIHYCLGAALARAEGHVVFDRLLERFPVDRARLGRHAPRVPRLDRAARPRIATRARRVAQRASGRSASAIGSRTSGVCGGGSPTMPMSAPASMNAAARSARALGPAAAS